MQSPVGGPALCFCAGFRDVSLVFLDVCAQVKVLADFFIGISTFGGWDGYYRTPVGGLCCAGLAVGFRAKTDLQAGMWRWGGLHVGCWG